LTSQLHTMDLEELINMKNLYYTILIFYFSGVNVVFGQDTLSTDYPFLFDVPIEIQVSIDDSLNFYIYEYKFNNPETNKGKITQIRISASQNIPVSTNLESFTFKNEFVEKIVRRMILRLNGDVVPVGFSEFPGKWYGTYSLNKQMSFGGSPFIAPGETLAGFKIQSFGLPSIRELLVKPRFDVEKFFQSLDDPNRTQTVAEMNALRDTVNFNGFTVGPWLPDSTMSLQAFTDTLETYRQRSCQELGWANDPAVCATLESRLSDVRSFLSAGDSLAAAGALSEFINLVESEKEASLSSEGYALLFFNVDYLAGRLPSN